MPGRGRAVRRGRGRRVQPPRRAANRGLPDMQPEVPFQQPAAPAQPERQPARRAANRRHCKSWTVKYLPPRNKFLMHVPMAIKHRICKGNYINLSLLLKVAVELSDYANGSSILVLNNGRLENRPTECKDDIGTSERWNGAFIIYMDVYLSAHPHKSMSCNPFIQYASVRKIREANFGNNMITVQNTSDGMFYFDKCAPFCCSISPKLFETFSTCLNI